MTIKEIEEQLELVEKRKGFKGFNFSFYYKSGSERVKHVGRVANSKAMINELINKDLMGLVVKPQLIRLYSNHARKN